MRARARLSPGCLALAPLIASIATADTASVVTAQVAVVDARPSSRQTNSHAGTVLAPLQISTLGLPGGIVRSAYRATLAATGGTIPYNWSVTSGSLPPGLMLQASTGQISGNPTTRGQFISTIEVQDSSSPTARATSKSYVIFVSKSQVDTFGVVHQREYAGRIASIFIGTPIAEP